MKIEIKYVFECKDGFKFERETPQEILEIVEANYKALNEMANGEKDHCYYNLDNTNKYFPKGSITAIIDGNYMFYDLYTQVTQI